MDRERSSRRSMITMFVAAQVCLILLAGSCFAGGFSADLVITEKGERTITGKIYVCEDKIRQEIDENGAKRVMIFRPDKGVIWMVAPEEETYIEMPYQADNKRFEKWTPERENNARVVGEETVSGLTCKKYETQEEGEKTYFWISDRLSLPVRVQYKDGSMEYRNIQDGSLADSLFEVPPEYSKMTMPVTSETGASD